MDNIMDCSPLARLVAFLGSRKFTLVILLAALLMLTVYFCLPFTNRTRGTHIQRSFISKDVRSRQGRFDDSDQSETSARDLVSWLYDKDATAITSSQLPDDKTANRLDVETNSSQHDISDTEDREFMKQQAEIQRQRKQRLNEVCQRLNLPSSDKFNPFLVDEKYKIVFCSIPKVASTNWKLVFEKLAGVVDKNGNNPTQWQINRDLKTMLTRLNHSNVDQLNSFFRFLFVRNPFSRILSVYRNKLEPNSTFERAHIWQQYTGKQIMQKTRGPDWRNETRKYDLKFSEFIQYVSDDSMITNKHWVEYYKRCFPCHLKYDVIGKLETINDDAKYILKLAKINKIVEFEDPAGSSPTFSSQNNTLNRYFEDIPAKFIQDLYNRYQVDFELFGYDLPESAAAKLKV